MTQNQINWRGDSVAASPTELFLKKLQDTLLIHPEDWETVSQPIKKELVDISDSGALLAKLVELGLLTEHQAARISAGTTFGLILGNYRVLNRLGAGGMGVVFEAEHIHMRRRVAVKVFAIGGQEHSLPLQRFFNEIRTIAHLKHPNIIVAFDAGNIRDTNPTSSALHYFVMEYVPGRDLEDRVKADGPLPLAQACSLAYQVASALAEAYEHELVHRDIKPSNIMVTAEGQAKLLDFGLARQFRNRVTEPGTILGTVEFMAPEQMYDAGSVDIRADIYALGGVLFWCLTGRTPFVPQGNLVQDVSHRLASPPPSLRDFRPELSLDLDHLIARAMALNPNDRFPTPQTMMRALLPYLQADKRIPRLKGASEIAMTPTRPDAPSSIPSPRQILIIDDDPAIRLLSRYGLQAEGLQCDEASNGLEALQAATEKHYDLALLDIDMPQMSGLEALKQLRKAPPSPNFKIIMFSGRASADEMAQLLLAGADDYLTKPLSLVQLQARVQAALRLKEAQDRGDRLNQNLLAVNVELEGNLNARDSDLVQARNALVLALAKMVGHRDIESGAHLRRLQRLGRTLACEAAKCLHLAGQIDENFIQMLECCAPLHDIGNVGLPDHIARKPGKFTTEERIIMQTHTTIGADTLTEVAREHGFAAAFMQTAIDIVRHHHERWDGTGYPDRLAGSTIPLSARVVTIADVYDALRSRRAYRPAFSHTAVMQLMAESQGQFDLALLEVFQRCGAQFERIYRELSD
jgi:response regulator RpfG family c-di-GMP phosphodiesterase/tRNA A-37 threonylcarbamoyl transferase component Bud32